MKGNSCDGLIFPWLFLYRNSETTLKLLYDELMHLKFTVHFFMNSAECNGSGQVSDYRLDNSLRKSVGRLCHIIKELEEKHLKEAAEALKYLRENYNNPEKVSEFLKEFKRLKLVLRKLSETIEFLQKKLASLLEGFPGYYPAPKETSIRESVKVHNLMERLACGFQHLLSGKGEDYNCNRQFFYWDFKEQIEFLENDEFLIMNTDFSLPHRQSFWTVIFHEVIHHNLNRYMSRISRWGPQAEFNKEFELARLIIRYSEILSESIYLLTKDKRHNSSEFHDVFIDALLSYIFGVSHYLPMFYILLYFDDIDFENPKSTRLWYLRLYASLISLRKHTRQIRDKSFGEKHEKLTESLEIALRYAYGSQKSIAPSTVSTRLYKYEFLVTSLLEELTGRFLEEKEVKKLKKSVEETDDLYVKHYIEYLKAYTDRVYEEECKEKKPYRREGRAFCLLFNDIMISGEGTKNVSISSLFENEVHLFQLYRLRQDSPGFLEGSENTEVNLMSSIVNHIKAQGERTSIMYSFGSYTFLVYRGSYQEKEYYENAYRIPGALREKNIFFFKEDYSLTLIKKPEKIKNAKKSDVICEEIHHDLEEYVLLMVSAQLNREMVKEENKSWTEELIEKLDKFMENFKNIDIKICLTTSFMWHDVCILVFLRPKGSELLKLTPILKTFKESFLIDNEGLLTRTETHVFIGELIKDRVIVTFPHIHLRVSSKYLGTSKRYIVNQLRRVGFVKKVKSRYGIRDLIVEIKRSSRGMKFSDLLTYLYGENGIVNRLIGKLSDIQVVVEVEW